MSGKTWKEMFPQRRGVVLQDGHVDRITGPRCIVKMSEGPQCGLHIIAHTAEVLREGTEVLVDNRSGRTRARPQSKGTSAEERSGRPDTDGPARNE